MPEHTVTVLIGASGSGKSTLLRCINLLTSVDDGVIRLDGWDITDPEVEPDDVRRKVGMVFQSLPNTFPHLTVLDNITLSPRKVHKVAKHQAEAEGLALLERFALADKASQYPDRLSGGQQQRVAIVRSLAVSPRLMLMDEVTSALDPVLVNEVLSTVRELKAEGMTMVIATHEIGVRRAGGRRGLLPVGGDHSRARRPPADSARPPGPADPGVPAPGPRGGADLERAPCDCPPGPFCAAPVAGVGSCL